MTIQIDKIKGPLMHKHQPEDGYNYWQLKNTVQKIRLGALYNFFTISDPRKIAAEGWSVPLSVHWTILADFLGGVNLACGKLKESGTVHWLTPNTGATNSSKFSAFAGGFRDPSTGLCNGGNTVAIFWTSTEGSLPASAWERSMYYDRNVFYEGSGSSSKMCGYSIRLVKDSTDLADGETGIYIGNDGRKYATICIGYQEWTSENLVETQFQNKELVPFITDDTEWTSLATPGMCYFNNAIGNAFDIVDQIATLHSRDILSLTGQNIDFVVTDNGLQLIVPLEREIADIIGLQSILEAIELNINFLDLTPLDYNVPAAMKFTSQTSEWSAATLSIALNTNLSKYDKLTITPTAIGLVTLTGILL